VVFFVLEQSRNRFHSAESQAILPLAEETPRLAVSSREGRRACGCAGSGACARCRSSAAS
jgi:hypothetical protein